MESREIAMKSVMKSATHLLAGTAGVAMLVSVAFAQDQAGKDLAKDQAGKEQTGQVTQVNRLNNTIAIRPIQNGTVGANAMASEQFKVKDGVSLEDLHAGNHITYSVSDSGGTKTITKFKVQ
jgi:Cu/Ag efflux protein CusF